MTGRRGGSCALPAPRAASRVVPLALLLAACARRAPVGARDAPAAPEAAAPEPARRPLVEPTLPEGACHRALCVGPSDESVVPPYRYPFSRCAPSIAIAGPERQPGDAPEGLFSPSATRTGRAVEPQVCCYVVRRECDAGTAEPPRAPGRRGRRAANR